MTTTPVHYGQKVISLLKKKGEYGRYFTYEEYQQLKKAATAEEFTAFIRATKWRGVFVYTVPSGTVQDLRLLRPEVQLRGSTLKGMAELAGDLVGDFDWHFGCLIAPIVFLFVLCFPGTSRRIVRRWHRECRARLRKDYQVFSLPDGAAPGIPTVPPPS